MVGASATAMPASFSSRGVNPRPARTRMLYLMVGQRTAGRSGPDAGRGAMRAAFSLRAMRRRCLRAGCGVWVSTRRACASEGLRAARSRNGGGGRGAYLVEPGADAALPLLVVVPVRDDVVVLDHSLRAADQGTVSAQSAAARARRRRGTHRRRPRLCLTLFRTPAMNSDQRLWGTRFSFRLVPALVTRPRAFRQRAPRLRLVGTARLAAGAAWTWSDQASWRRRRCSWQHPLGTTLVCLNIVSSWPIKGTVARARRQRGTRNGRPASVYLFRPPSANPSPAFTGSAAAVR